MIKELKEISRNFDNNFDSFESILQTIDNLEGVQTYNSLYKNSYSNVISKLRMIKNLIKFISYKLNLNPMIKRFNKEKIGDRMKKNFIKTSRKYKYL